MGWRRLAWLMAQVFLLPNGVGWWATPLFVVPLFTTRLAYARYVETRELFEQTIEALAKAVDARDPYTREPLEPGEPHRGGDVPDDAPAGERDREDHVGRAAA